MAKKEKDLNAHTPLMKQYLQFKDKVGDMLLFFRVGDFYELFWEDSERIAKLLDLMVAKRGVSGGRPVTMSGVPWHSLDTHLSRLVRMGVSAAVVDQIGDPATSKGPVERAISRIVTPGTLLDEALLNDKKDAPLLGIAPLKDKVGLFWCSLSSGQAHFCSVPISVLPDEIARISPAEIIAPFDFSIQAERVVFRGQDAWHFDAEKGKRALKEHFGSLTLDPFGLTDDLKECLAAACAVYEHASASMGGKKPNIQTLSREQPEAFLQMDASTRKSLEVSLTQRGEESPTLLSSLDLCSSSMGSRTLRSWLESPQQDLTIIQSRHLAVESLLTSSARHAQSFLDLMRGQADIERAASRAASLASRPRDFSNLKSSLSALPEILAPLSTLQDPLVKSLVHQAQSEPACLAFLSSTIADEPSIFIRDGGVIRDGKSAELDELRALSTNAQGMLTEMEARERQATGIATLRLEFSRAHGFAIEITKAQSTKVPEHYRRKQTLKNAERYTTDELELFEAKALSAQEKALALEKELFEEAQRDLCAFAPALLRIAKALGALDTLCAFAKASLERNYCKPTMLAEGDISITGLRHPVAELDLEGSFIANDVHLNQPERSLLITGPNMGGKSTYMRSVAALFIMAQAGCFVPAKHCSIPTLSRLFARVGASDDISRGKSTFMVEMSEAAGILRQADHRSLCIIDEIGRGTSTFDGMSLAWAILRHLHEKNKSFNLFSTHYFELTELADERLKGVKNVHMTATSKDGSIVFLHALKPGAASQSHGVEVAKLAGVPETALVWAAGMLSELADHDKFGKPVGKVGDGSTSLVKEASVAPALAALISLDPDTLTPKAALEALYALKGLL